MVEELVGVIVVIITISSACATPGDLFLRELLTAPALEPDLPGYDLVESLRRT
jgi:hypothetical protein